MVRYIVTGAAGHLGSTVIRQLLEEGQQVRGLILPSEESSLPGAEYVRGDVLKPENLGPLFHRDSNGRLVVIHTAGLIDVSGGMSYRLYEVNVTGTKNILALCQKYHVDKLVYVQFCPCYSRDRPANCSDGDINIFTRKCCGRLC